MGDRGHLLVLGDDERAALRALQNRAEAAPISMPDLAEQLKTPAGKDAHRAQMTAQSVMLPDGIIVCFSVEDGDPCGRARHMSISLDSEDKVPHPYVVEIIMAELGFVARLRHSAVWLEDLAQGKAVNVVQPWAGRPSPTVH